MSVEELFRLQLRFKVECSHDPQQCVACRYGHLFAEVASEFLAREDFDDDAILRWLAEVERRRVELKIDFAEVMVKFFG